MVVTALSCTDRSNGAYTALNLAKIWGRARVVDDDPALLDKLALGAGGRPEQAIVFEITGWDRNCPQFITPRFTEAEVNDIIAPLHARIAELELLTSTS